MTGLRILYGGTFDPIHNGHLAVAQAAVERFDAEVFVLPAGNPPHRDPPELSAVDRAELVGLAISQHPRLHLDSRELARPSPSFSLDTVLEIREERGGLAPLAWLLGEDAFAGLHRWHGWEQLLGLCHWIIAVRPDRDGKVRRDAAAISAQWDTSLRERTRGRWSPDPADLSRSPGGLLALLDIPPQPESATRLRQSIRDGDSAWEQWVPAAVAARIRARGLYRSGSGGRDQGAIY